MVDWVDPHTQKYKTNADLLDAICIAWMSGRSRKDIILDTGAPATRVNRILDANFQIEWIDGAWGSGIWRHGYWEEGGHSTVEMAAPTPFFEYLGMIKRLTREPLMGAPIAAAPPELMRCNLCKVEWFNGQGEHSGCFHATVRSLVIALSIFGGEYAEPDPSKIPYPLTTRELDFFKHSLLGLLNERLRDLHYLIKAFTTSDKQSGIHFDLDAENGSFLKSLADQSGATPIDEMKSIILRAMRLIEKGGAT